MSNEEIREMTLQRLMKDNFLSSKECRKLLAALDDIALKEYFQNLASKRSQFAIEISEEIRFYGGKKPYFLSPYERNREEEGIDDDIKCIKKALKTCKASLLKYQESLCRIYDGTCREVLIRHKAYLEHCVFELKALKSLLKYRAPKEEHYKEIRSHS